MFRRCALICLIIPVVGCMHSPPGGLFRGENLMQTYPLPEGDWHARESATHNIQRVEWRRQSSPGSATTMILKRAGGMSPYSWYRDSNEGGHANCESFDNEIMDRSMVNGYERKMWRGECLREGGESVYVLHLFISGRDASYYLSRTWTEVPDPDSWDVWVEYMQGVSVCDTRVNRESPCPQDLEKV